MTVPSRPISSMANRAASRYWWDLDADNYQAEHGEVLGDCDLVWCPEGLREADVGLLGEVDGKRILEAGCGAASGSRWLAAKGAQPVALDISGGMLRHAREGATRSGVHVPLVQADAMALPFRDASFDMAFTAYGAVPFVDDSALVMREVHRVLRTGGRWVFSVTHPVRWCYLDDAGPDGLVAVYSYFDRTPYIEYTDNGVPTYVEHHRTLGDRIRELIGAGFLLEDLVEPEWPADLDRAWLHWSPLRGRIIPGTAIFVATKLG